MHEIAITVADLAFERKRTMKKFSYLFASALALVSFSATAQNYPDRPITLIVPFVAGGPADAMGRVIAQGMSSALSQSIVIENLGGAGGTLGAGRAARAQPDGYTMVLTHSGQPASATLYRKLPYDPVEGFDTIGMIAEVPMAVIGKKDLPPKDARELLDLIRTAKDGVSLANGGIGSASHLCGLLFMTALQTKMHVVPYRSAAPALNDVLGGRIDVLCDQTISTTEHIKAGSVKGYATTMKTRVPTLPDVPTLHESGLPGFDLSIWYGLLVPKGTPQPVIDKLASALKAASSDAAVVKRLGEFSGQMIEWERANPGAFAKFFRAEAAKLAPVITASGSYAD
jgi:tripartite-type tricarboxylate transporter receptor subunit TctC